MSKPRKQIHDHNRKQGPTCARCGATFTCPECYDGGEAADLEGEGAALKEEGPLSLPAPMFIRGLSAMGARLGVSHGTIRKWKAAYGATGYLREVYFGKTSSPDLSLLFPAVRLGKDWIAEAETLDRWYSAFLKQKLIDDFDNR